MQRSDIRTVRLDEYAKIQSLYEGFFGAGYYGVEKRYFDWLHRDAPWTEGVVGPDEYSAFGAFENGELIGCINYVPIELVVHGETYTGCWTPGWLAREDAGLVIGMLINRYFRSAQYFVSMGLSTNMRTLYSKRPGVQFNDGFERPIMVLDAAALGDLLSRDPSPEKRDYAPLADWAAEARRLAQPYVTLDASAALPDGWVSDLHARAPVTTAKSPAYLDWRYRQHPWIDYAIVSDTASDGGIAIIRIETIDAPALRVARVVEFLPRTGREATLARAVASFCIEHTVAFADFFCASNQYCRDAVPAPFVASADHDSFRIPRLFQPLEWRSRSSINASLCKGRGARDLPSIDFSGFYLTKGDSSQDVLVNPGYRTKGF